MKRNLTLKRTAIIMAVFSGLIFNACAPIKEFKIMPAYDGANHYSYRLPAYDSSKKTVVIVANNDGTELFDMLAPFYLFNSTGRTNVYIVAKNKVPVIVKKGIFILPQSTFREIDSMRIKPDVIVIPFLSVADSAHQDPVIVKWIQQHYSNDVNILSVCDGSATAAATGLFDAKPITAHASDYAGIKTYFSKPVWKNNIAVANEGNLYSTAGVSNATEGSLMVIEKMFGTDVMKNVIEEVYYPGSSPKTVHESKALRFGDNVVILKKLLFKKNKKIGVLLQNNMNEFQLAGIMDTYNRSFPASIQSFSFNDSAIQSKYGLTIIPTGKLNHARLDELHVVETPSFSMNNNAFTSAKLVTYHNSQKRYIIDECLQRINSEYGKKYKNIVKLMLDYN